MSDIADKAAKIQAFEELCAAECKLYVAGHKHLHDAVDRCQNYAVAFGLLEVISQDEVQYLMACAFGERPGGPAKKQLKKGDYDPFGEAR